MSADTQLKVGRSAMVGTLLEVDLKQGSLRKPSFAGGQADADQELGATQRRMPAGYAPIEAAISRFSLWTVPVPKPVKCATLPMPTPLASSELARSASAPQLVDQGACAQYRLWS